MANKEGEHMFLSWKWTGMLWVVRIQTNIATAKVR